MAELSRVQILKNPEVLGIGNTGAKIRLLDADENSHIDIKVPDTVGTAYTFTLPADDGTPDYYLKTDGNGNTSWAAVSASPGGSTNQIQYNNAGSFAGAAVTTDGTNLYISSAAQLRFGDSNNSNYVGIAASSTVTDNRSYILPDTVGTAGQVLKIASSPSPTANSASLIWADDISGGAGGSPAGSDTQVQFNDAGVFGADAGLTYNKNTDVLSVTGGINLATGAIYKINNVNKVSSTELGGSSNLFTNIYGSNIYLASPSGIDASMRYSVSGDNRFLNINCAPGSDQFGIGHINLTADIGVEATTNAVMSFTCIGGCSIDLDLGITLSSPTDIILDSTNFVKFYSNGISIYNTNLDLISIDVPATITSGYTITLPASNGSADEIMQFDASQNASFVSNTRTLNFVIDGGGSVITTGSKGYVVLDGDYTVTGWTILADQSGSIVVDVNRATYANFPTFTNIDGTEPPTLSAARKAEDLTLSTWTTTLSARDVLEFNVASVSTVTRVTVALRLVPR